MAPAAAVPLLFLFRIQEALLSRWFAFFFDFDFILFISFATVLEILAFVLNYQPVVH